MTEADLDQVDYLRDLHDGLLAGHAVVRRKVRIVSAASTNVLTHMPSAQLEEFLDVARRAQTVLGQLDDAFADLTSTIAGYADSLAAEHDSMVTRSTNAEFGGDAGSMAGLDNPEVPALGGPRMVDSVEVDSGGTAPAAPRQGDAATQDTIAALRAQTARLSQSIEQPVVDLGLR